MARAGNTTMPAGAPARSKGIAAKLIAQRLHQSGGQNVKYGPEGELLHGGLQGKTPAERNRTEKERVRRHNEEIRSGSEKGKEWQ